MRTDECSRGYLIIPLLLLFPNVLPAQDQTPAQGKTDLTPVLERLDRLEQENRALSAEVSALRSELAAARGTLPIVPPAMAQQAPAEAPLAERVAVQEQRIAEQAQTKVEAANKLPITLTGLVLFNAFVNGRAANGQEDPVIASSLETRSGSGATLSQSMLGFTFQGPRIAGGGLVSGQMHLDLWGGSSSSLDHLVRLRVATLAIDWKNQSLVVGQDKPIISPRDPTSLAQVAVSPLAGAGNPWMWQPQIRFEQRVPLGEDAGIRAIAGVYETSESTADATPEYAGTLSPARPAVEGRFELWRKFGEHARIEIAPGFHTSQTHVAGVTIPSRLFSVDWMIQPMAKLRLTGLFLPAKMHRSLEACPGVHDFLSGPGPGCKHDRRLDPTLLFRDATPHLRFLWRPGESSRGRSSGRQHHPQLRICGKCNLQARFECAPRNRSCSGADHLPAAIRPFGESL